MTLLYKQAPRPLELLSQVVGMATRKDPKRWMP